MAASIRPDTLISSDGPPARASIRRDTACTLRVVDRGGRRRPRSSARSPSSVAMKAGYTTWMLTPLGPSRNELDSLKAERAAFDDG